MPPAAERIPIMYQEILHHCSPPYQIPLRVLLSGISWCDETYSIEHVPGELFVFEFVEQGRGTLCVDGRLYHPCAGDVYIAPGWTHNRYWSSASDPWVKYWWNVSGPLVEALLKIYNPDHCWHFRACAAAGTIIRDTVLEMQRHDFTEFRKTATERRRIARHDETRLITLRLTELMMALAQSGHFQPTARPHTRSLAARLRKKLQDCITTAPPTLEELGEYIGRSPEQVIRIFKAAYGTTPYDFLLNEKISIACGQLRSSDIALRELAHSLGFRNEFYFSRLFKRRVGIAPDFYRRNLESGFLASAEGCRRER